MSLFDDFRNLFSAWGEQSDAIKDSRDIQRITNEIYEQPMYYSEFLEKQKAAERLSQDKFNHDNNFERYKNNLQDSALSNVVNGGGMEEGIEKALMGRAVGAGLGALVGNPHSGYRVGGGIADLYNAYNDAESAARDAYEKTIQNGGNYGQAYENYKNALPKQFVTTIPEVALGQASGLLPTMNVRLFNFNPMKFSNPYVESGANVLGNMVSGYLKEGTQDAIQNYVADTEGGNGEYSLGGFKDYLLSPQGRDSFNTAGIMGALVNGVGQGIKESHYHGNGVKGIGNTPKKRTINILNETSSGNADRLQNIYDDYRAGGWITPDDPRMLSEKEYEEKYGNRWDNILGD